MWKTGDPEMATPKRVRTYCPKHSNTSLSREWRINMTNKKKESRDIKEAGCMEEGREETDGVVSRRVKKVVRFVSEGEGKSCIESVRNKKICAVRIVFIYV